MYPGGYRASRTSKRRPPKPVARFPFRRGQDPRRQAHEKAVNIAPARNKNKRRRRSFQAASWGGSPAGWPIDRGARFFSLRSSFFYSQYAEQGVRLCAKYGRRKHPRRLWWVWWLRRRRSGSYFTQPAVFADASRQARNGVLSRRYGQLSLSCLVP